MRCGSRILRGGGCVFWLGDAVIGIAWGLGSTGLSLLLAMGWGPAFGGNGKVSGEPEALAWVSWGGNKKPGYHK